MILKTINQIPFIRILIRYLKKLTLIIGTISLLLITILIFHYFNSGMYERYKPLTAIKKIDEVIFDRYFGFSFFEIDDYIINNLKSLKFIFFANDLDNVKININQKNLNNLELQRRNKLESNSYEVEKFSRAQLNYDDDEFKIKLRVKGDRVLHWYNKNETSYRIDLRGNDRIWGLEEFSFQKPITRNYIYEYIFHKFLEFNGLISLKYFFINLSINDNYQGVYAVEEGFSKELLIRNNKIDGPIFGLEESKGIVFPKVEYDLYSKSYWQKKNPELIEKAFLKLDALKKNDSDIEQIFDLEKWATYLAIIDITGSFHGSIPKSVKFYFNPETYKFEPIGYDGHYNSILFQNFLILDFLDSNNKNCSYICSDRDWYLKFLSNEKFKKLYLSKLKEISSSKIINDFFNSNFENINFYNNQFLSETSKKDRVMYKGLGHYIFDSNYLFSRSDLVSSRIN